MLKALRKRYHSSHLKKSTVAIRKNPRLLLYIFLLDAAFFAVFYILNLLVNNFIPQDPSLMSRFQTDTLLVLGFLLLSVLYFVVILVVYSFFTLIILGNIRKFSSDYSHDFSMLKNMFALNLILFIMFFLILVLFNVITALLVNKSLWLAILVFVVMFVMFVMAYAFYNFSHSAFILGHRLKSNLKRSLRNVFTKSYLGIIIFSLVVLAIYVLVYLVLGYALDDKILANYDTFINTSSIITLVLIYVLFTFNRIYFFFVAEKKIGRVQSS